MPAGTPYIISNDAAASASSFTTTIGTAPNPGDTVVLSIGLGGAVTVTSVTDPRGNTYTVDNASSSNRAVAFAYCVSPPGLLRTGDLITINLSAAQTGRVVSVGIPGIAAVDLTPAGNGNAGGSSPSAATGSLNALNETCLGVICNSGGTQPSALSWNLIAYESSFPVLTAAYLQPGATQASQTFAATITGGAAYDIAVMTLALPGPPGGHQGPGQSMIRKRLLYADL